MVSAAASRRLFASSGLGSGRACPVAYRYTPEGMAATARDIEAEVLLVVGGLYGNVEVGLESNELLEPANLLFHYRPLHQTRPCFRGVNESRGINTPPRFVCCPAVVCPPSLLSNPPPPPPPPPCRILPVGGPPRSRPMSLIPKNDDQALAAVERRAAAERDSGRAVAVVFNGDFNFFNADPVGVRVFIRVAASVQQ